MTVYLGGWVSDAVGAVKSAVGAGTEAADSVGKTLGVSFVTDPVVDFWNGPLKDWAHTDTGKVVLRAMVLGGYMALVPIMGPQMAAISFAFPGLVRGEDFTTAFTTEFAWRLEKTAEILGADIKIKLGDEVARVSAQLSGELSRGNNEILTWTTEQVADYLSARYDVTALALAWIRGSLSELLDHDAIDPKTGGKKSSMLARAGALGVTQTAPSMLAARSAFIPITTHSMVLASAPPAPTAVPAIRSTASSPGKVAGDVLLAGVIVAAGVALVWWYQGQKT